MKSPTVFPKAFAVGLALLALVACDFHRSTEPSLTSVQPASVSANEATPIILRGKNLLALDQLQLDGTDPIALTQSWRVFIGTVELPGPSVVLDNSTTLRATIPKGAVAGQYIISIQNPHGLVVPLGQLLTITQNTELTGQAFSTTSRSVSREDAGTALPREQPPDNNQANGTEDGAPRTPDAGSPSPSATVDAGGGSSSPEPGPIVAPPLQCSSACNACGAGDCCREACEGSGCPTCSNGCACDLSCPAGNTCETECEPGTSCWMTSASGESTTVTCNAAACAQICDSDRDCTMLCVAGANCELDSRNSNGSTMQCVGSRCKYTCTSETSCNLTCEAGADCELHCSDSGACSLGCDDSSSCLLDCARTGSCDIQCDSPTACADGTVACNRSCP